MKLGKLEEVDTSGWDYVFHIKRDFKYLVRFDNGAVKPLEMWTSDGIASTYYFNVQEGIDFAYLPLDSEKYFLIFEITDTQSNKYCSELIDVDVIPEEKQTYTPEDINIEWTSGDRIKLFEAEGSILYLKKIYDTSLFADSEINYCLEVENPGEQNISYTFSNIIINGDISTDESLSIQADAGKNEVEKLSGLDLADFIRPGVIDSVFSISGEMTAEIRHKDFTQEEIRTIEKGRKININISGEALEENLKKYFGVCEGNVFVEVK